MLKLFCDNRILNINGNDRLHGSVITPRLQMKERIRFNRRIRLKIMRPIFLF